MPCGGPPEVCGSYGALPYPAPPHSTGRSAVLEVVEQRGAGTGCQQIEGGRVRGPAGQPGQRSGAAARGAAVEDGEATDVEPQLRLRGHALQPRVAVPDGQPPVAGVPWCGVVAEPEGHAAAR